MVSFTGRPSATRHGTGTFDQKRAVDVQHSQDIVRRLVAYYRANQLQQMGISQVIIGRLADYIHHAVRAPRMHRSPGTSAHRRIGHDQAALAAAGAAIA